MVDSDPAFSDSSSTSRYDGPYREYQRTATMIASGGTPESSEAGSRRWRPKAAMMHQLSLPSVYATVSLSFVSRPVVECVFRHFGLGPRLGTLTAIDENTVRAGWTDGTGATLAKEFMTEREAILHIAKSCTGGLRFHDLRHSYATWLIDDGVPVNMVQRVMGHERSSTTLDLYTRRTDDHDRILQAFDDDDVC